MAEPTCNAEDTRFMRLAFGDGLLACDLLDGSFLLVAHAADHLRRLELLARSLALGELPVRGDPA